MSLKVQVSRGLKWQLFSIAGRQILSFAVFTTLARLLDPASFGLFGLVGVYIGFVRMFADQGIGAALIQRRDLQQSHLDTAFWFNATCASILCLVTILFAGSVSRLFNEPQLVSLLRWSSIVLVIEACSTIHTNLFIKDMDFRSPVIRTLLANAIGGGVGVIMAFEGHGVWALVGQQLTVAIVGAVFLWSVSTYRPSFKFSWTHLRELFNVSSSVFASGFLWYISSRIDQIVISHFAGTPALGLYVIANKVPELAKVVTLTPVDQVALPALSRLQDDHVRMRQAVCAAMELNAVVSFAVFVGIACVASDVVPLLFGAKWTAAALICSMLSLSALITTLAVFFHPILLASGGAGKYLILNLCHPFGALIACLIGIRFGIPYLILGLMVNSLIIAVPALFFLRQRIGLTPGEYCKPCFVPALASFFMAFAVCILGLALPSSIVPVVALIGKIAVGGGIYIGFIYIFKRSILTKFYHTIRHAFGGV